MTSDQIILNHSKSENLNPINVLIVPAWYNHKDTSSGVFIHEFCERINDQKVNATLLYLNFFNLKELGSYLFSKQPKLNVSYNVIVTKILNLKSKYLFFLNHTFILNIYYKRVLKEVRASGINFDVIHIQSLCNNVTPYISKRLSEDLGISYVITEHYTSYHLSKGNVFRPFMEEEFVKRISEKAKYRIAVSQYAAGLFSDYFKSNFQVIYNLINERFFKDDIQSEKNEKFTFITIGALDTRKGSMELLCAFKKLLEEFESLQLIFIGKGNLEDSMKRYIADNQLIDAVKIYGWMDKGSIIQYLDKSHVLVSASELETFGLTIAEAGLRGLPVIATKSGGPEELITEQNGLLIDKENKEIGLYNAMKTCYLNYKNYNSNIIRQSALVRFDADKIKDSYYRIYQNCKNKTF